MVRTLPRRRSASWRGGRRLSLPHILRCAAARFFFFFFFFMLALLQRLLSALRAPARTLQSVAKLIRRSRRMALTFSLSSCPFQKHAYAAKAGITRGNRDLTGMVAAAFSRASLCTLYDSFTPLLLCTLLSSLLFHSHYISLLSSMLT